MGFIEVTLRHDGTKTMVNLDHILRWGALIEDGEVVGTYFVTTADAGLGNGKNWFHASEVPELIEDRLVGVRVNVIR